MFYTPPLLARTAEINKSYPTDDPKETTDLHPEPPSLTTWVAPARFACHANNLAGMLSCKQPSKRYTSLTRRRSLAAPNDNAATPQIKIPHAISLTRKTSLIIKSYPTQPPKETTDLHPDPPSLTTLPIA